MTQLSHPQSAGFDWVLVGTLVLAICLPVGWAIIGGSTWFLWLGYHEWGPALSFMPVVVRLVFYAPFVIGSVVGWSVSRRAGPAALPALRTGIGAGVAALALSVGAMVIFGPRLAPWPVIDDILGFLVTFGPFQTVLVLGVAYLGVPRR